MPAPINMIKDNLKEQLIIGAQNLEIKLTDVQTEQLLTYLQLLLKWNKIYNLTNINNPEDVLSLHLLDCLAVTPIITAYIKNTEVKILDIGSGAGLPGVIISIIYPDIDILCIDSSARKISFIQQVSQILSLNHLHTEHQRVEKISGSFNIITSRAFSSLNKFTSLTDHLLTPEGVWLAMKGKIPQQEIDELTKGVDVFHVEQVHLPNLDVQRCVVMMRKNH